MKTNQTMQKIASAAYQELELWENRANPLGEEERLDAAAWPLCRWYEAKKRDLPWRKDTNPYHIWISEIMLQQTRVEAVKPYYARFMEQLPDVSALADCPDEQLMKLWEGLGYYSRARNLKKAAQVCCGNYEGKLPGTWEKLLALPGIGSYTAGAIASIAYGEQKPAVDGNVLRVAHRLLACADDILSQKVKKALEEKLEASMKRTGVAPGTFNQALMELGACVCIPNGEPLCSDCPWERICLAHQQNRTGEIPWKQPKKPRKIENRTVLIVTDGEYLLLRQRPQTGLLAGLYEPLQTEGTLDASEAERLWESIVPVPAQIDAAPDGKHIFSHIEWHMKGWKLSVPHLLAYREELEKQGYLTVSRQEIREQFAIPKAFAAWKEFWE